MPAIPAMPASGHPSMQTPAAQSTSPRRDVDSPVQQRPHTTRADSTMPALPRCLLIVDENWW